MVCVCVCVCVALSSYPVHISILTSAREGNSTWQLWEAKAIDFCYIMIYVTTYDQFDSTASKPCATNEA